MTEPLFRGVGVAIVTLFDDDGALDEKATADFALRLVEHGMQSILIAGTTGEASSLDRDERRRLLFAVREVIPKGSGVAVLAGTGAPSAYQAAIYTADANEGGADGVLALSPPGSVDLHHYYRSVVDAAGETPVLGYHFPNVSAPGIPVSTLLELPVVGLKDSSGDATRLLETLTRWDQPLYTGSAVLLALAGPAGCSGAILALANAEPELCIAAFGGDANAQLKLAPSHLKAIASFPKGIKGLTSDRFGTSTTNRMG